MASTRPPARRCRKHRALPTAPSIIDRAHGRVTTTHLDRLVEVVAAEDRRVHARCLRSQDPGRDSHRDGFASPSRSTAGVRSAPPSTSRTAPSLASFRKSAWRGTCPASAGAKGRTRAPSLQRLDRRRSWRRSRSGPPRAPTGRPHRRGCEGASRARRGGFRLSEPHRQLWIVLNTVADADQDASCSPEPMGRASAPRPARTRFSGVTRHGGRRAIID